MPNANNYKRSNNLLNLDSDEFLLWKEDPITRLVIQLHQDRKDELLARVERAALDGKILSDIEQVRIHEAIGLYEDFIDLEYLDIDDFYQEEIINEDDTTSMGTGISATG